MGELELRAVVDPLLRGWSEPFRGPRYDLPDYEPRLDGVEVELTVPAEEGTRTVRGRLSTFPLLAGRFWAAAEQDGEAYRLRGAWVPTLLDAPSERPGIDTVVRQPGFGEALQDASRLFAQAAELDEAALCLARSAPYGEIPNDIGIPAVVGERVARAFAAGWRAEQRVEVLLTGLKRADPVERLQFARACEAAVRAIPHEGALALLPLFRPLIRALLADVQPALFERGLALTEAWVRRLWSRRAYRECAPLLDALIDANVMVLTALRMRLESRLAIGDLHGARTDRLRLTRVRGRAGDLLTVGSDLATEDPNAWYVSSLVRVARAHRDWAEGRDPCPDKPAAQGRLATHIRRRHLESARNHLREAIQIARTAADGADPTVAMPLAQLGAEAEQELASIGGSR